ncbi:MAG: hypothetical protein ACJASX_004260 [Limisphaerales bacterium]|jgi:hypothetical protein
MKRIITHSIKLLTAVALLAFAGGASAHDDHELIELVMKKGHKGKTSLVAKVKAGKNTAAELKELHDMYVKMAKTKAEKGGQDSWKAKTAALVAATDLLLKGDAKGKAALNKAVNCKACHSVHK